MIYPKPGAHIHLIGIGGTAMSALAGLLQDRGYQVTGSDLQIYPPVSTLLESLGVPVFEGYSAAHLETPPDLVVVGNALSRGNEEIEIVLDRKLAYASLPEVLRELFLCDRETLVVAGTHGKTTVTSIVSWIFQTAGLNPGFMIGGLPLNFPRSFSTGSGRHFILEGDEYDTAFFDKGPKFLHYRPDSIILTSVEFDHADIYRDLDAVKTAFKRLVNLVPQRGIVVAQAESGTVSECIAHAFCPVETFGFNDGDWRASELRCGGGITEFAVSYRNADMGRLQTELSGEHNVRNVLAAVALARHYHIAWHEIKAAIATFRGVRRRLEIVGEANGVTVIDDFAHHPTAIRETLRATRTRFPGRRLWALVEPRSNTLRRNVFESELVNALALADHVVIAGVYNKDKLPSEERLNPEHVLASLRQKGISAQDGGSTEQMLETIIPRTQPGDVLIAMSNGGFGGIHMKLLRGLARAEAESAILPGAS